VIKIVTCIVQEHDLRLVVLAAVVCAIGSYAALSLLHHAGQMQGRRRSAWLVATAVTAGTAIWSTHFIAMLAFRSDMPIGYHVGLTILSLIVAVAFAGGAVASTTWVRGRWSAVSTGLGLGLAIATMHFTGMAALEAQAELVWDPTYVMAAVLVGLAFAVLAIVLLREGDNFAHRLAAYAALVAAITGHHFTAMAAISVVPDPLAALPGVTLTPTELAASTALAGFALIFSALAASAFDRHEVRRRAQSVADAQALIDAAVEALVIVEGPRALAANSAFLELVGIAESDLPALDVGRLLTDDGARTALITGSTDAIETDIARPDGSIVPVEMHVRGVSYDRGRKLAASFRDLRRRRKSEQRIRFLAFHDTLTELGNRSAFAEELDRALAATAAHGRPCAVLAVDLDRFKPVNDTLGHQIGDRLLQLVASRIRSAVGSTGVVARIGGDEFAVLVSEARTPDVAKATADNIVELLARPFLVSGNVLSIGASVGIAQAPDHGTEAETLLQCADLALYRAKAEGRGTSIVYEPHMQLAVQIRRNFEIDLHRAVAQKQFVLHYQPLVDTRSHRIVGFESLIRWHHPDRGPVSPADFIPIAEDIGLIVAIGEWVIETACATAATWPDDVSIAVNLSPRQFSKGRLVAAVRRALEASGLAAHRLELEITETALLKNSEETLAILSELRAMGVRISMDDFGTGYSSLSYLRSFPFDKIKIDRSFVSDGPDTEKSEAIVAAVVELGRSLGMTITAEGVESLDQSRRLGLHGCDHLQGFYFSRPVPADKAAELLAARSARAA
jgi:diguanylate cyclase (GGDEF)-like protein